MCVCHARTYFCGCGVDFMYLFYGTLVFHTCMYVVVFVFFYVFQCAAIRHLLYEDSLRFISVIINQLIHCLHSVNSLLSCFSLCLFLSSL
jgi:hypothetical protein